jgi:hypothetical protein
MPCNGTNPSEAWGNSKREMHDWYNKFCVVFGGSLTPRRAGWLSLSLVGSRYQSVVFLVLSVATRGQATTWSS